MFIIDAEQKQQILFSYASEDDDLRWTFIMCRIDIDYDFSSSFMLISDLFLSISLRAWSLFHFRYGIWLCLIFMAGLRCWCDWLCYLHLLQWIKDELRPTNQIILHRVCYLTIRVQRVIIFLISVNPDSGSLG